MLENSSLLNKNVNMYGVREYPINLVENCGVSKKTDINAQNIYIISRLLITNI